MKKLFTTFILLAIISLNVNAQWQPQWSHMSGSPPGAICLAFSGTNIFAGTENSGVFLLSDTSSSNWLAVNTGLTNHVALKLATCNSNIFASTLHDSVFFSANNGANWISANNGLPTTGAGSFAVGGANVFAGTNSGVYKYSFSGNSWIPVNTGLTDTIVYSLVMSGMNLFAGTNNGLFLSSDTGNSWTVVNTGLPSIGINNLSISGTNILAYTDNGVLLLTTNNGANWTIVNNNSLVTHIGALALYGTKIFEASYNDLIYLTTDYGTTWDEVSYPYLPAAETYSMAINGLYIYAVIPGSGVYRCPLDEMTDIKGKNEIGNIAIFPNPATNNLTIETPISSTIKISNIQGQLIKTLVTSGNKTNIDVSVFPCGVYIVEVKTEKGVGVKRFVKE